MLNEARQADDNGICMLSGTKRGVHVALAGMYVFWGEGVEPRVWTVGGPNNRFERALHLVPDLSHGKKVYH